MCMSSTPFLLRVSSTRSLDVDDTLSLSFELCHNNATSSHSVMTLLKNMNLLPYKVFVKKSPNIVLVGYILALIFRCFALSSTQKKLIPVCLDLLEHDIFLFLDIFSAASLSCHTFLFHWVSLCFQDVTILNGVQKIITVIQLSSLNNP